MSPAAAVVEAAAAEWLVALLGLPAGTSVGFTTGATMANFTALAAARHAVLARVGWDVGERGLGRAPLVAVVVGAHVHASVQVALRMLGFGSADLHRVAVDDQGRMRVDALAATLADVEGPLVVCAQAGHVCTGAFDPLAAIADAVAARGGWLHVDGAFGLWAATAPARAHLIDGVARADSWATDAHKWLNVPYDSGVVLVRDRQAHRAASAVGASYLVAAELGERDGSDWVPELSRRARGFTVYAALRSRSAGCRGARRALLRAGAPDGRPPRRGRRRHDSERRRAEPGAGPLHARRGWRRGRLHARRNPACARGRHVLARRHDVARDGRDADQRLELVDDRGRRRLECRRDPALPLRRERGVDRRGHAGRART
jgi:glutamate/tyrosine decarboxylase-like PLP-dependent enzyme